MKKILFLTILLAFSAQGLERKALLISADNALKQVLQDLDFEIESYNQIELFEFERLLKDFKQNINKNTLVFFYYSGSAIQMQETLFKESKDNYLLFKNKILYEAQIPRKGYPITYLIQFFADNPSIIILNIDVKGFGKNNINPPSYSPSKHNILLFSNADTEFFSYALVKELSKEKQNIDQVFQAIQLAFNNIWVSDYDKDFWKTITVQNKSDWFLIFFKPIVFIPLIILIIVIFISKNIIIKFSEKPKVNQDTDQVSSAFLTNDNKGKTMSILDTDNINELHDALFSRIENIDNIHVIAELAKLNTAVISWQGNAFVVWMNVLKQAQNQERIPALLTQAKKFL